MRNKLRQYGVFFFVAAFVAACSSTPSGVLSEKKMQSVLIDMELAEAMISSDYQNYKDIEYKKALYQSVFRKHGITEAEYDSSLVWYGRNLDIYMRVYDRAIAEVNQRITNLGNIKSVTTPVVRQDSIDIWPKQNSFLFSPDALFNGITFDIKPEKSYSAGSIFVLGIHVFGLNENMTFRPEVRIFADQGDTIVSVISKITQDGYIETVLKTLPTIQVKQVYGSIFMNNADSCYYKVYVDSLNLMKYNYGSFELKVSDDKKTDE